jgi:iron complex outermembrane recepter protein
VKKSSIHRLLVTALVLTSWSVRAPAQQQSTADQQSQSGGLEEIVVTAERRAESTLSVPASVAASTGQQLRDAGIWDITSLQFTVPGFLPSDSVGYTQLFVRGIGNSVFVGADPSVVQYIDDVPFPYPTMITDFVDVERVEILKGAQGGLYGRNATGGVMNIITRQPSTDKFAAESTLSYGDYRTARVGGYLNIPLSNAVAFSVAAERDTHDPYIRNITDNRAPYTAAMFPNGSFVGSPATTAALLNSYVETPDGLNSQSVTVVHAKLLVKPIDDFKITFASDWANKTDTNGNGLVSTTPAVTQAGLGEIFGLFGIATKFPPGFLTGGAGKYTTTEGFDASTHLSDAGGSVTAVWSLPGVDLTSISAFHSQHPASEVDISPTTVPVALTESYFHKWFLYQELRAVSTNDGPWHYLGGATYLSNHTDSTVPTVIVPPLSTATTLTYDTVHNWSAYLQGGYDITRELNLTVSGRYVHETNTESFLTPPVPGTQLIEDKFLPSATLSYKFEGGGNAYARYAKGWKAGGINPVDIPSVFPGGLGGVFGPETVDTYEVGYRAPLFNRNVQLTTAVFYNNYQDLQTSAHANAAHPLITFAIVNAGSARTYGAEETLTWRIIQPVTVGINAGYLNAKYKNFSIPENSPVLEPFNLSGTTMLNAPTWQLSFTGNLDQPLNDRYRLVADLLETHVTSVLFTQSGDPGVLPPAEGPAYWLTNIRLGIRTTDDRFGFALYCNNVFDAQYYVYGSSSLPFGNILGYGNPRIMGAEISVKY